MATKEFANRRKAARQNKIKRAISTYEKQQDRPAPKPDVYLNKLFLVTKNFNQPEVIKESDLKTDENINLLAYTDFLGKRGNSAHFNLSELESSIILQKQAWGLKNWYLIDRNRYLPETGVVDLLYKNTNGELNIVKYDIGYV